MKISHSVALLMSVLLTSHLGLAHEGHDHAPGQVQPTRPGGQIQKTKNHFVEVVGTRSDVKIYFLGLDLKPLPTSQVRASATLQLPRKKTKEVVPLAPSGDHFTGKVDVKNAHRYQLEVELLIGGTRELLTYQIEPQD